jgi:hypothetical protein
MLTLGEPCKSADLTLAYNSFSDVTYYLQENSLKSLYSLQSMIKLDRSLASSTSCGSFDIEFASDAGEEVDAALFEHSDDQFVVLRQEDEEMLGSFEISYKVFLVDYPDRAVKSSVPFTVTIVDPCVADTEDFPRPSRCPVEAVDIGDLDDELPEWMAELDHQEITLFDSKVIAFGEPENTFGQEIDVEVDLGGARTFVKYDAAINSLIVDGDKMLPRDIGTWQIFVIGNDTTFSEEPIIYEKSFYLRIIDFNRKKETELTDSTDSDQEPEAPTKTEKAVVKAEEFVGEIRDTFEPEVVSPG